MKYSQVSGGENQYSLHMVRPGLRVGSPIGLVLAALWGRPRAAQRSAPMRLCSQLYSLRPLSNFLASALWNDHMTSAGYIPCFQPVCIACAGGVLLATVRGSSRADP